MNTYYEDTKGRKLVAVKVNGKWRMASRRVGKLLIVYGVDMSNMLLIASYGNGLTASMPNYIGWKVEDIAWSEKVN